MTVALPPPAMVNLYPLSPPKQTSPKVTWDRLPDDFILPEDPVDNNLQPLLAEALRESLELAGLCLDSMPLGYNVARECTSQKSYG